MATPEFILKLREKIGHDPLWLIGVTAYVEDAAGRILLGRRVDTGEWALVYGIVDPGEEPARAAAREVREETGVDCVPRALVGVRAGQPMTYANGDQCRFLDVMFACELDADGNAEPFVGDDESLSVGWFAPDELPSPLAASTRERLARLAAWRAAGASAAMFEF